MRPKGATAPEARGAARRKAPALEPQTGHAASANLGSLLQEERSKVITASRERGRLASRPLLVVALAIGSLIGLLMGLVDRARSLAGR